LSFRRYSYRSLGWVGKKGGGVGRRVGSVQPTKPPPTQEGGSDGTWVGLAVGNGKVGDKVKASEGAGVGKVVDISGVGSKVGCGSRTVGEGVGAGTGALVGFTGASVGTATGASVGSTGASTGGGVFLGLQ